MNNLISEKSKKSKIWNISVYVSGVVASYLWPLDILIGQSAIVIE